MKHNNYPVTATEIAWETTINSVPKTFYIPTYHSIPEKGSDAPLVMTLNGIGERAYSASVAPSILGENVISPRLPFQGELEPSKANFERIASEVPELVARAGLALVIAGRTDRIDQPNSVVMIGRSQSAAPAIRSVSENPDLFSKLALIEPFSLNQDQLGDTPEIRRRTALLRLARAAMRANPFDIGNMKSTREVVSYLVGALRDGSLMPAFDAAMTFDMVDELKSVAESKPTAVFVGARDPLFAADEITANLAGSKADVITVPGTHATPGSRAGRRNLYTAYDWATKEAA